MHREYNDKISNMKECIQKKCKLKGLLKQTEKDMIREKLLLNKLSDNIEKKNQDILKLNTTNVISLFCAILGNEEERFDKEKQELLKARLRYDQCVHNVEYLANESKKIVDQLTNMNCCDSDYEDLINKKIEVINIDNKEKSETIKKLIKRKESMIANIKEIDEAIVYGEESLKAIEGTIRELENAKDWGLVEVIDGNVISTSLKHSHIDEARKYAEESQRMLRRFKRETSDIVMITGAELAVVSFEKFADHFFDGLIYDWVVQSNIGKSLDYIKNSKNQTDKALSKLYEEKFTEEFMVKQIQEQLNCIIENA